MATFRKRAGGWRAEVCRLGVRASKTFPTKAAAQAWATQRESEILEHRGRPAYRNDHTLHDAFLRYAKEVSPTKKGQRWELLRLNAFSESMEFVGDKIEDVSPDVLAKWRDLRLTQVSTSTVRRELALLSSVFNQAMKEWRWCSSNPAREITRPRNQKPRDRRVRQHEIKLITDQLGYKEGKRPELLSQELAVVFLLAIETAMRQGEILSLEWSRVFISERYVHLDETKNGSGRDVPLSSRAVELLSVMRGTTISGPVFRLRSGSADALFRKARSKVGLNDLNFHDSRHEATTRLAAKLDVLELARVTGHKDLRSLMVYYNATASELAKRLD